MQTKTYLTVIYLWYILWGMARKEIKVLQYECERCEHKWIPREIDVEPKVCPKCKSPYWDSPRKNKIKEKK